MVWAALLLPPRVRKFLKDVFPFISNYLLADLRGEKRWQHRQARLQKRYDLLADSMLVPATVGLVETTKELILVSPTSPTKNGIANYSSLLVAELGSLVRVRWIRSFVENREFEFIPGVRASFPPGSTAVASHQILYMLGNGEHHWNTWRWILEHPGYILVHDARFSDMPLIDGEDPSWHELDHQGKTQQFLRSLPTHTKGIFVHSEHAAAIVRAQLSRAQSARIPIHVLSTGHPAEETASQSKLLQQRPLIGTFGFQDHNKNLTSTYSCLAYLASKTNGRGVICGKISAQNSKLARRIWLDYGNDPDGLTIYSWVDKVQYNRMISSVDAGVLLRNDSNGESSGPFTQLTSKGAPTVVSDLGTFTEFPSLAGVVKLPVVFSNSDLSTLLDPMVRLLKNPSDYRNASAELQAYYRNRTYASTAREILAQIY